jgi:hypothetical protein
LTNISNFKSLNINHFLNLGYSVKNNEYQKNRYKNKINDYNDNMYITGVQNDYPFYLNDNDELNTFNNMKTITSPNNINLKNNQNTNNIKTVRNKFIESSKNRKININNNM